MQKQLLQGSTGRLDEQAFISLVIPVFNDGHRLPETIRCIERLQEKSIDPIEAIFVDDGSTDDIDLSLFSRINFPYRIISYEQNEGKGEAVRRGMLVAHGEYRIFTDSDFPYQIDDVLNVISQLKKGYDVVIGDRTLENSYYHVRPPLGRRVASTLLQILVRLFLLGEAYDYQCGLKGFQGDVAQRLFTATRTKRFAIDIELLAFAQKWGLKIKHVPVSLSHDRDSGLKLMRDSIQIFCDFLKIVIKTR
jgi:glycosyltransferase involved in cell wall biosynthesis